MNTDYQEAPLDPNWDEYMTKPFCSCVIDLTDQSLQALPGAEEKYSAYYDCPNCLGYGVMPVPMRGIR